MGFAVLACDSDKSSSAGPGPFIELTAAPISVTIQQGASGLITLTLVRGGGFSGTVALAVAGLPAGMIASVSPTSLSGTTTTATVTVDVAGNVVPGPYTATVTGSATGVQNTTTVFTVAVTAAPDVALTVTPATLTVQQGASGSATVNITRTAFTGQVALSLDAPPPGVIGTFSPASAPTTSSALTVAVAATVAPGAYTLTIKGSATGVGDRTTTLALTVTAAPATIAVALAPPSASVVQGGSGQTAVNITRTSFSGPVSLAASGAPAGVTIGFSETPTAAAQVQLTYAAALTAPIGTHLITVTASAGGVSNATATFTLQVAPASPSGQVEFQFCSSSEDPVFFASQDGSGAWQRVTGTQSSGVYRYTFSLTQNRGGVFYVQESGTPPSARGTIGALLKAPRIRRILPDAVARLAPAAMTAAAVVYYETTVVYGTTNELAAIGAENCLETRSTKTVSLAVTGVREGEAAALSLGGSTEIVIANSSSPPVQTARFAGVRSGTIDLFGARADVLGVDTNRLVDVRNLNPADGSTLPFTLDFNGPNAYAPAMAQVTVANSQGDNLLYFGSFFTANGEAGLIGVYHGVPAVPETTRTWPGVPTARLQPGDVHANMVFATPQTTTTDELRLHIAFSTTVQDITQTLGPRLPTPTLATVGQPNYRRFRLQGALPAEYSDLVAATFGLSGGGSEVTVIQTGAYITAAGSPANYDLSIPDLTALAGFPLASGLPAGQIEAILNASGWTGAGTTEPLPANGAVLQSAARTVKITVP
jgi:hypothetical protein